MSIRQTGSRINPHHCSYEKIAVKYLENGERYDVGLKGGQIGNHPWAFDWHHNLWPCMTLNLPSSRSLQLQLNISITVYGKQQCWADTRSIECISRLTEAYMQFSMKFGHLILRNIIKFVATRCQILRPKCIKINFGWGSAPYPAGGACSAPPDP